MTDKKITILLATYKGGRFISEQLNSIIDQSYANWELWIRDDCSSDNTLDILIEFTKIDKRINIFNSNKVRLGACQNFSELMSIDNPGKYVMFCDQDDIWMPSKIEKSLQAIKELENLYGSDKNLMVYGTYQLIDNDGIKLPLEVPDYSAYPTLNLLLSQNYIYGCTMMINRNLLNLSKHIPVAAENHDYWISLVAVSNGAYFSYIKQPLIYYRQHTENVSGSYINGSFSSRIKRLFSNSEVVSIKSRLKMFGALFESNVIINNDNLLLKGYIEALNKGGWEALKFCIINKIVRRGSTQTLLFYFNMLRTTSN